MHAIQTTTAPAGPALPAQVTPVTAFQVAVQLGPQGVQYVATTSAGGRVLARSGWHADLGTAWAALGSALAPMLLRTANRAVS